MAFLPWTQGQAKQPFAEVLPDGRKRLTRYFQVQTTGEVPPALDFPPGTADDWPDPPSGWSGLLLTYKKFEDSFAPKGQDTRPILTLIYEQINATAETQVGEPAVVVNQYSYLEVTFEWVQFSTGTPVLEVPGTTAAPAPFASTCILRDQQATDDGTLRRIKRTYVEGGFLAQYEDIRFGGKLIVQRLKYLNEIPPTPSGYTKVTESIEYVNGLPVYEYGFASASASIGLGGVISDETNYSQSDDQGATGVTVRTITQITDDSVVSNPIATPSGFTLIGVKVDSDSGYKRWTATFAKGVGLVTDEFTIANYGKLLLYHRVALDAVPSTPSPTIGTVVLIDASQRNANGYIIYDYRWAEGEGLISQDISAGRNGLREVTNVALGTRVAPSGIIVQDDYRNDSGYVIYRVTAIQAADGNANPTTATYSTQRYVNFTYPGRAKAYAGSYSYFTLLDVFKSPPITTLIPATVTITYQTTNTLPSITDFWNPLEWATINAQWVSFGENPHNLIESLPGYRSVDDTPVTATCSAIAPIDLTIFGNPVYGGTTASVQTTGGPEEPDGNTYTLSADLDPNPAFTSTAGTNYYRLTVITATIPAQPALPV